MLDLLARVKDGGITWRDLEEAYSRKRTKWVQANREWLSGYVHGLRRSGVSGCKIAYNLFIRKYLKLSELEAPVVYESENKLIWCSRNPCPVVEACNRLQLDT